MDSAANIEEQELSSEFARTIKYIDLYFQQKTDLFLQHYVFEPVNILLKQIMSLTVIVTLLAAGIITLLIGVILFVATIVPLWASLLSTGAIISGIGIISAHLLLSNKIILNTPIVTETRDNENR